MAEIKITKQMIAAGNQQLPFEFDTCDGLVESIFRAMVEASDVGTWVYTSGLHPLTNDQLPDGLERCDGWLELKTNG
jgi:hypothetical protein